MNKTNWEVRIHYIGERADCNDVLHEGSKTSCVKYLREWINNHKNLPYKLSKTFGYTCKYSRVYMAESWQR